MVMATESDKLRPKFAKGEFTGWSILSDRYDVRSTTDKFNCFVDAISQAIEIVRKEGDNSRILLELLFQLEDKRNETNSSPPDFLAGKSQKGGRPAEFSSNLKKVNAAASIDAFMALGLTAKDAAEYAGKNCWSHQTLFCVGVNVTGLKMSIFGRRSITAKFQRCVC